MANIRVLIAEDEPLAQRVLEAILEPEADLEVVGMAASGPDAVARTLSLQPDVLLLDLYLLGLNGLEVARQLARQETPTRILALTRDGSEETILKAFRAGVKGYLPKVEVSRHLTKAIRAVAAGETWIDRRTTSRLVEELKMLSRKVEQVERPDAALSQREREVLVCIGRGLTNKQIAGELFLSVGTVKVHVSRIFEKLGLPNRIAAALFARRIGLVAEEPMPVSRPVTLLPAERRGDNGASPWDLPPRGSCRERR